MNRLARSGRALWLVVVLAVACNKGDGNVGRSAGVSAGASAAGGVRGPRGRTISPSSASIVPARFASNGDLTQWVDRLTKNAIGKGRWDRTCKPGCSKITVDLSVIPGAHLIDYGALDDARPAVAIIEPVANQPANKTTADPYAIETGNFTYVVYVERDPQNAATQGMLWHILKIPYSIVNNSRVYDLTGLETLGGHPFVKCTDAHPQDDDDAAFKDCNDAHPAAKTRLGAPPKVRRADTAKLLAPGGLARAFQDTSRGDPLKPLWVSCLDGCCTANGT